MQYSLKILGLIAFIVASNAAMAQNKIVIDDRASVLNAEVEQLLQQKLLERDLYLTNSVDFREKCDYYFASITKESRGFLLEVQDCDNQSIGSVFAGSTLESISNEERTIIIYYNLMDIINNPGIQAQNKDETEQMDNSGPLQSEHDSRYFFAPSALPVKKGELYYNTLYFLSHDIQYGVTDRFTLGLGTTLIGFPFYVTAKYSIPIQENSHLAFGDLLMVGTYGSNFFGNLAFATYTYGDSHNNISLGAGHLYFNPGDNAVISSSIVGNLSGIVRAGKYFYFLSENYLFNFQATETAYRNTSLSDGTFIYQEAEYNVRRNVWYGLTGIRFVRKDNELISWQFGLTHMLFVNSSIPAPYNSGTWDTYSYNEGTRMIAFPTLSFTRKFKL
jgi:hypothetical protein